MSSYHYFGEKENERNPKNVTLVLLQQQNNRSKKL
jgi:hypothetical protein